MNEREKSGIRTDGKQRATTRHRLPRRARRTCWNRLTPPVYPAQRGIRVQNRREAAGARLSGGYKSAGSALKTKYTITKSKNQVCLRFIPGQKSHLEKNHAPALPKKLASGSESRRYGTAASRLQRLSATTTGDGMYTCAGGTWTSFPPPACRYI